MNPTLFKATAAAGFLTVGWVASGYLHPSPLAHLPALVMTVLIAACFGAGVRELHRFNGDTAVLQQALDVTTAPPAALPEWLAALPASLRAAVQGRVAGERIALPGPALTPYLVGLLVLLGMLGTFLGMVVTLSGTGLALERATDVQTMRDSLSAPVRGLGLAFGTSVAGVAASALLGLLSAFSRRARVQAGQSLDGLVATTLRPFTPAFLHQQQRDAALALQQQQAEQMPALVLQLQTLSTQLAAQAAQSHDSLQARQQEAMARTEQAYQALAQQVGDALQRSLEGCARAAAATLLPAVETTMAGITRETAALHGHVAATVQQQLDGYAQRFEARSAALIDALGTQLGQQGATLLASVQQAQAQLQLELRGELSSSLARDNAMLDERTRIMDTLNTLLGAVQHTATEQKAAIDRMVASTARWLDEAGARFTEKVDAEGARLDSVAAQLTGSAAEVASLGEAFGSAVTLFAQSSGQMVAQLQRVEEQLARTSTRSDEQLAYYVAQAREVIDLSLLSQKQIVDDLQRLARKQPAPAAAVASEA